MMSPLSTKIGGTFQGLVRVLQLFPVRVLRLVRHLFPNRNKAKQEVKGEWIDWWNELLVLLLACTGIAEFYEILSSWIKFNTRALAAWEIEMAQTIFGDSIDYESVRVDERAFLGPKQQGICYVSFFTINSWGTMHDATLLHELTHVWQYQQLGAVYIPRALRAQFTAAGYNYGGVDILKQKKEEGASIFAFNLEQQGDIVSDYFLISNGYAPQWGTGEKKDLPIYDYYIEQFKSGVVALKD